LENLKYAQSCAHFHADIGIYIFIGEIR